MTANKKNEILKSLESLDQAQAEKVMEYIKGLVGSTRNETYYRLFKREAMKEIRQALNQKRNINTAF
jgi:hypothetical protein